MFDLNDVHLQNLPAIPVAAFSHHGDYMQIGATFERLMVWAAGQGLLRAGARTFGIYYDDPQSKPPSELRSEACGELPRDVDVAKLANSIPAGARITATTSGRCAVFIFTGPYSELSKPYRWLYDTWLPQSGEEPRNEPCFEEYLNDVRITPPSDLKTAICIPLQS